MQSSTYKFLKSYTIFYNKEKKGRKLLQITFLIVRKIEGEEETIRRSFNVSCIFVTRKKKGGPSTRTGHSGAKQKILHPTGSLDTVHSCEKEQPKQGNWNCLPETTLITDHGWEMRSDLLSCKKLSHTLWYDHTLVLQPGKKAMNNHLSSNISIYSTTNPCMSSGRISLFSF